MATVWHSKEKFLVKQGGAQAWLSRGEIKGTWREEGGYRGLEAKLGCVDEKASREAATGVEVGRASSESSAVGVDKVTLTGAGGGKGGQAVAESGTSLPGGSNELRKMIMTNASFTWKSLLHGLR